MDTVEYLKSLKSVRDRTTLLLQNPGHLKHFDVNLDKLESVADLIIKLIARDYQNPSDIPPHSRWRHFEASNEPKSTVDRIGKLVQQWTSQGIDADERIVKLIDLFVVGVLVDAGAGNEWKYVNETGVYARSEGLAIAAFDAFAAGFFSAQRHQSVDAQGLAEVTVEKLAIAFQSRPGNSLIGLEGRCLLLQNLGKTLEASKYFTINTCYRPGNLLHFLKSSTVAVDGHYKVDIKLLWEVVIKGFSGVWPATRTKIGGSSLGDAWPCKALQSIQMERGLSQESDFIITFHKLSQWLTYSLMEPLKLAGIVFLNAHELTGLAEYRNGGLFVDMGVLVLKDKSFESTNTIPRFNVNHDLIVEWRGLTIPLLDMLAVKVREKLQMEMSLPQILEAGIDNFENRKLEGRA